MRVFSYVKVDSLSVIIGGNPKSRLPNIMSKIVERKSKDIPSHSYVETADPNLFRLVDRKGDWSMYYLKEEDVHLWAVNRILDSGYNKGIGFVRWLLSKSPEEAQTILEEAGNKGTRIHAALADLVHGHAVKLASSVYSDGKSSHKSNLTDEEWHYLRSFVNFVEDYKPISFSLEQSVASSKLGWAGTYDWICTLEVEYKVGTGKKAVVKKKRIKVLLDFKSSNAIHDSYNLQLAAYWLVLKERKQANGLHTGVLRVGTKHRRGYELKLWSPQQTAYHGKIMKAVNEIHLYKEGKPEPRITEFPSELKVKIPDGRKKITKTKSKQTL